ncbi:hypothetical protein [Amphritea japonica]|uniref:Uncharacterized protein n=1 Tax=Amphritea japonica ATCC BAA-1530 TaxID=1278309 RepID=A0A7R6SSR3_9GAMM|nr:hypothetical protein [Amphritea japonica]BBB26515.1 conserved hypothetical protein [Amphritea japonica ATCC BAA-1530]
MKTRADGAVAKPVRKRLWLLVIMIAWVAGFLFSQMFTASQGLAVTFHNSSEVMIDSIQLDFGSSDTQSRIQAFRIAAGEERLLRLNHEAGMGFNVLVKYRNGIKQEFCALRSDEQSEPVIHLRP